MNSTKDPQLTSKYEDSRRPVIRALQFGSLALVALTVLSLIAWGLTVGVPGVWGVLLGAAIGGGFVLLTALSVLVTSGTDPTTTMAVVLGGWLLKTILLVVVLIFIRDLEFYHRGALLTTVILALIAVIGAEVWAIVTTRVTYVSPK